MTNKRAREQVETSKAFAEAGWHELTNKYFKIGQLASALQDRNKIRLELRKKDNEIRSILQQLVDVPQAGQLVNATDREYRQILEKLEKEDEIREAPKKKRKTGKEEKVAVDPLSQDSNSNVQSGEASSQSNL